MLGRRRHLRFLLAEPLEGSVQVREDISIENWERNEMVVLSPEPGRPHERLRLEFPERSRRSLTAVIVENRPAVNDDGSIRHRLRLLVEAEAAEEVDA